MPTTKRNADTRLAQVAVICVCAVGTLFQLQTVTAGEPIDYGSGELRALAAAIADQKTSGTQGFAAGEDSGLSWTGGTRVAPRVNRPLVYPMDYRATGPGNLLGQVRFVVLVNKKNTIESLVLADLKAMVRDPSEMGRDKDDVFLKRRAHVVVAASGEVLTESLRRLLLVEGEVSPTGTSELRYSFRKDLVVCESKEAIKAILDDRNAVAIVAVPVAIPEGVHAVDIAVAPEAKYQKAQLSPTIQVGYPLLENIVLLGSKGVDPQLMERCQGKEIGDTCTGLGILSVWQDRAYQSQLRLSEWTKGGGTSINGVGYGIDRSFAQDATRCFVTQRAVVQLSVVDAEKKEFAIERFVLPSPGGVKELLFLWDRPEEPTGKVREAWLELKSSESMPAAHATSALSMANSSRWKPSDP